jgi:hypothetical protein
MDLTTDAMTEQRRLYRPHFGTGLRSEQFLLFGIRATLKAIYCQCYCFTYAMSPILRLTPRSRPEVGVDPAGCNYTPGLERGEIFFHHEPIDIAADSIRLVKVLPQSTESDIIQCAISLRTLGNEHVCLSYTWGEEPSQHLITLNGKLFRVRKSLWSFLDRARRLSLTDSLWIDAICIDQWNTKEKNHQVKRMAKIYEQAQRVLIWLPDNEIQRISQVGHNE